MDKDTALREDLKKIDESAKKIAQALNLLEAACQEAKWACERQGWNDEVCFQIEEAAKNLGYSLATLCRWNDAVEEG